MLSHMATCTFCGSGHLVVGHDETLFVTLPERIRDEAKLRRLAEEYGIALEDKKPLAIAGELARANSGNLYDPEAFERSHLDSWPSGGQTSDKRWRRSNSTIIF